MLTPAQIDQVSQLLVEARRNHQRITQLPTDCEPRSFEDAYAIQQSVWERLGMTGEQRISSWKCGAQTPDSERFVAPIYAPTVFANNSKVPSEILHEIAAESEIAYRIGKDLHKREQPYSDEEIRDAIDAVVITIEVCDSRIEGWRDAPFLWQCADSQNSGAMIVGDAITDWQSIDMGAQEAQLWVNGQLAVSRVGGNTVVDPFKVVNAAVNQVIDRTGSVKAGDLFTAGSWVGTVVVEPGTEVIARFPGLGEARARFTD